VKEQHRFPALTPRDLALLAIVAAAYVGAGKLGLRLALVNPSATPVWAPTGIALGAFLIFGRRVWPAILLGAFLVNLTTAGNTVTSLCIAVGNTLEGMAGAYLARRFAGGRHAFERTEDVLRFALLAGFVGTLVSPTIGVTSLTLAGSAHWSDFGAVWLTWWLGDAAGALIVAPLVITWSAGPRLRWTWGRVLEAATLLALLVVVGKYLLATDLPFRVENHPLKFLCLPLLIWPAIRFGQREAATAVFVISGIAIWGALGGAGPFQLDTQNVSFLLLQLFLGTISVATLAVGAAIFQRHTAEEALRNTLEKLEIRVADRTKALRDSEQSLRHLSTRLLHLQDEERRRLARELHDSTGQKVTALALHLAIPSAEAASLTPRAREALSESCNLAEEVVREIRTLSYLLHPPFLDELGLAAALRWYAEGFAQRSGIRVDLNLPATWTRAPKDTELALFRIVQESLTNIHRHSASSSAKISLSRNGAGLQLEIEDAGRGIPAEVLDSDGPQSLGVGLRGMRERVNQLGGQFQIHSNSRGTIVKVSLPQDQQAPPEKTWPTE
jgi:signal transduction histidine kinase